jgi:membrane associated rhomboid family serine protease
VNYRNPRTVNLTPLFVLIGINILVFFATSVVSHSFFGISTALRNQIGVSYSTFSSQPWTIVTAMFAHDGIFHILFNMLALYFYGMYVIALVGEARFFLVYFIGGLIGNALFLLLAGPNSIAVGASGAVFALGGLLVVLVPRLKVMIFPIPIPVDLWIAIIIFALISLSPGVAWEAHFGGLLTGLAAGYVFKLQARRRRF